MLNYVRDVWSYRYFWGSLVRMDVRSRYRGTWLGLGWSLLQPVAMAIVMGFAFSHLFGRPIATFIPFLLAGLTLWQYLTDCTVGGSRCLVSGESFMRQVHAPMAIYPLRTMLTAAFHLCVGTVVVLAANILFSGWHELTTTATATATAANATGYGNWHELASVSLAFLALPLVVLFGWSAAVLTGFMHAYFPDASHLTSVAMRMLFYITPIIYSPEMMRERGVGWIVDYNPMAAVVSIYRMPLLGRGVPETSAYAISLAFTTVLASLAVLTLARLERKVIFQL